MKSFHGIREQSLRRLLLSLRFDCIAGVCRLGLHEEAGSSTEETNLSLLASQSSHETSVKV